mmetsp:Transcript_9205/g.13689  ORF Transcript_9205/g.13689 Transcript_9205/m.13689 type:complete len:338 (+) Transcript_9205:85-1098(+)
MHKYIYIYHYRTLLFAVLVSGFLRKPCSSFRVTRNVFVQQRFKFELNEIHNHDILDKEEMERKIAWAKHTILTVGASIMCIPPDVLTTPPMVDPRPPTNTLEREHRLKIMNILSKAYPNPTFEIPQNEVELIDQTNNSNGSGHNPSTYGEVTSLGARQLFHYMEMIGNNFDNERKIHFIDLGSGNGKLVVQAYIEIPGLIKAEGIELSPSRHSVAINSWNNIEDEAKCARSQTLDLYGCSNYGEAKVQLFQGDLFEMNISQASHIYIASLCFTDSMMMSLARKCGEEGSKIVCIATLKPLPEFESYGFVEDIKYVEMSWTKPKGMGGIVYFYSRSSN